MTCRKGQRPIREISDADLINAPHTWLSYVQAKSGQIWFRPSDTERQLAEHCVRYAEEVLRLRKVVRSIRDTAQEEIQ